jgi:hypothetical protein
MHLLVETLGYKLVDMAHGGLLFASDRIMAHVNCKVTLKLSLSCRLRDWTLSKIDWNPQVYQCCLIFPVGHVMLMQ